MIVLLSVSNVEWRLKFFCVSEVLGVLALYLVNIWSKFVASGFNSFLIVITLVEGITFPSGVELPSI